MVYTIEVFQNIQEVDAIVVVCLEDWIPYLRAQVKKSHLDKVVEIVPGGRRGQDSIYNGLVCARRHYADDTIVLIHDGVRPLAMNLSLGPGPVIGSASHLLSPTAYEGKADYVFHLAGNASPYFINSDPVGIMKCNLLGTINVLEYARDCQTKKVIFASTREVYGKNEEAELLDEQALGTLDPLDDRSCYPESKRAAETLLKSYFLQYGVNFNAIRIAHSYGPTYHWGQAPLIGSLSISAHSPPLHRLSAVARRRRSPPSPMVSPITGARPQ